jgi:hypothetical protein
MLLLIEFARITIEDNECAVLYFEPVRTNLFYEIELTISQKTFTIKFSSSFNEDKDS